MVDSLLKDENDFRQENIDHIVTKDQIHLRMQLLTKENDKLKQTLYRIRQKTVADTESNDITIKHLKTSNDNLEIDLKKAENEVRKEQENVR